MQVLAESQGKWAKRQINEELINYLYKKSASCFIGRGLVFSKGANESIAADMFMQHTPSAGTLVVFWVGILLHHNVLHISKCF